MSKETEYEDKEIRDIRRSRNSSHATNCATLFTPFEQVLWKITLYHLLISASPIFPHLMLTNMMSLPYNTILGPHHCQSILSSYILMAPR
jgi:hypothetical protein